MYCRQNNRYILWTRSKFFTLCFLLLLLLSFSGCAKSQDTQVSTTPIEATVTATQEVLATLTSTPTPTIKPSASITIGEEITATDAQALLEERLDNSKYSLDLLSESVQVDDVSYIAFIAYEDATPLEPVLIVNKYNGKIACMSKEGKLLALSNFPLKSKDDSITKEWNGTYYTKDKYERIVSTLSIIQNDNYSFEFFIQSKDNLTSNALAGIGHIDDNNAIFTDESNHELVFTRGKDSITLYDNDVFNKNGLSINGTYYFASNETTNPPQITSEQATKLISQLSITETKLPAEISEYDLKPSNTTIIVKDRICYEIGAYAEFEGRNVLMTTFYVSIDGNITYIFDNIAKNSYTTIEVNKHN